MSNVVPNYVSEIKKLCFPFLFLLVMIIFSKLVPLLRVIGIIQNEHNTNEIVSINSYLVGRPT